MWILQARTLSFTTSGTQQSTTLLSGSFAANTALDLTGALSYSAGSNQFTGAVNNTGSTLTGTATGRFFGPACTRNWRNI
jgi:carbohydrate-selective porin OprB